MARPMTHCRTGDHNLAAPLRGQVAAATLQRAADLFRAMGDSARLQLLVLLAEREWCVTEIVDALAEKFSTVSQRLRVLRAEGLVKRRRDGTHLYYAL